MVIKRMRPGLIDEWLDFFDNRAFEDHRDWKGCYCTAFYYPRFAEYESASTRRRDYARWLVASGHMKGYLAFENGKAIGWCNANTKDAYPRTRREDTDSSHIRVIACFIVEERHRGRGVAQKLLDRVILDSKKEGIRIIEAYPKKRARSQFGNFPGPHEMYLRNGFVEEEVDGRMAARRYLKGPILS
jgi:GNAT superfamily N-acetyltransferase